MMNRAKDKVAWGRDATETLSLLKHVCVSNRSNIQITPPLGGEVGCPSRWQVSILTIPICLEPIDGEGDTLEEAISRACCKALEKDAPTP